MNKIIRLCAIGDCCADVYSDGRTNLGGTAYNVAIAAQKAGAQTSIFSAVGSDEIGKQILANLRVSRVDMSHLRIVPGKTSSIPIHLDSQGKPVYGRWDLGAMKNFHMSQSDQVFLKSHDIVRAVMFTPIKHLFEEFYRLNLDRTIKVGDFAGTSADSIDVSAIEPYADGLDVIIKSVEEENVQALHALQSFARRYSCMALALLGSRGSKVFTKEKTYYQPAQKIETKNTIGAGDVYQAYFLTKYLQTKNIPKAMRIATEMAARAITSR